MYDVIIVGAGAAGLTAAVYTCRKKLKTTVISIDVGGQTNLTSHIENYPGTGPMHGIELMRKFQDEAIGFGAEIIMGKANKVEKIENGFQVWLANGETYKCKALILAYGKVPKSLGIEGEDKFMGRGVSTCVTCDAPLFGDKIVAVIGGGNSAVEGVIELSNIAKKVYIIHRREDFRADEITVNEMKKKKNVELLLNTIPLEIVGDSFVKSLKIQDLKNKKEKIIQIEGVFTEIGYDTDTTVLIEGFVETNELGEIVVDQKCKTKTPGVFAAGDLTMVPHKQTVISAGMGAVAALEAHKYILDLERK